MNTFITILCAYIAVCAAASVAIGASNRRNNFKTEAKDVAKQFASETLKAFPNMVMTLPLLAAYWIVILTAIASAAFKKDEYSEYEKYVKQVKQAKHGKGKRNQSKA